MNGDLISKSALLEEMSKFVGNQRYLISEEVWRMVENAPTAYGVDKVVERLEGMKYVMMGNYGVRREVVNFEDLVEIVKSGGID